jgi:hypothetical protein
MALMMTDIGKVVRVDLSNFAVPHLPRLRRVEVEFNNVGHPNGQKTATQVEMGDFVVVSSFHICNRGYTPTPLPGLYIRPLMSSSNRHRTASLQPDTAAAGMRVGSTLELVDPFKTCFTVKMCKYL